MTYIYLVYRRKKKYGGYTKPVKILRRSDDPERLRARGFEVVELESDTELRYLDVVQRAFGNARDIAAVMPVRGR